MFSDEMIDDVVSELDTKEEKEEVLVVVPQDVRKRVNTASEITFFIF
jgi:hypothetical protein